MHPGAWLAWATAAGLVAMSTTNPFYLLPLFGVAWVVHAARGRAGPEGRSFRIFAGFGLVAIATRTALVLFGPVSAGVVILAALEGLRLAVMLAVFGAFNSVSDPHAVLRLAPRRWHEPALAGALALTLAPRTIAAVGRVREAQRMRGIDVSRLRSLPALVVPVLETGMEEAVALAETMDARGHGRGRRSRYRPPPLDASSVAVGASGIAALLVFLLASGGGDLGVAAAPLEWPQATWIRLAAVLLLALPALARPRARRR